MINNNNSIFLPLKEYVKICKSGLITPTEINTVRPFKYPWAFAAWKSQASMFWFHPEVPMAADKEDWKTKLSDRERNILKTLMLFFTQTDVDVNQCYTDLYLRVFTPIEIKTMLVMFASIETVHIFAYEYLMSSILSEDDLEQASSDLLKHQEMVKKSNALHDQSIETAYDIAKTIVRTGAFGEGVFLFASFAMFLYFTQKRKLLNGTGQIITWSMRDETLHVETMSILFRTYIEENPGIISDSFVEEINECAREMVALEEAFINLVFKDGDLEEMKASDIKEYVRFVANHRLQQFGFKPIFKEMTNPLSWMGEKIGLLEHTNFFESKVVDYSKGTLEGDFSWDINPNT